MKNLKRFFNEKIDREVGNIVDTFEDRIKNAILNAIDSIIAPKIELLVKSFTASSEQDATSDTVNSERGERVGLIPLFENVSERNNTFYELNTNDETQNNIPE